MKNGELFVKEILSAINSPFDKGRVAAILSRYSGEAVYLPVVSCAWRRIDAAKKMLDNHTNAEIVEILRERFQVAKRTAQQDVQKARKTSLKKCAL